MQTATSIDLSAPAVAVASTVQFVAFSSGSNHYGVDIMAVREIRSWQPATQLAGRSPVSRGVLDIRGQVVEVLDLAVLLGGKPTDAGRGSVVLVLSRSERTLGLLVDSVSDIIQVGAETVMALPASTDPTVEEHVFGMANHDQRLIALLDVDALL